MSMMLDNNHMIEQQISGGFLHQTNKNGLLFNQCNSSSSSSSIGINSDDEDHRDDNDDDDDDEVESKLQNSPFNSAIQALEQALPIRRGISNFYNGKSKSFTSLADTSTSSVKDLTKPEDAYTRKRKRLLAYSLLYDKGRTSALKSPRLGISKKSNNASRNTLALAVAIKNCEGGVDGSRIPSLSPHSSPTQLPPWRSFSLADLQHCAMRASALNTNLMGKRTKNDEIS